MKISTFILQSTLKQLLIKFPSGESCSLDYEYLRVFSPDVFVKEQLTKVVAHKKQVRLTQIESVAKHGYRFIFDDGYSAIYSDEYLALLVKNKIRFWAEYTEQLQKSGLTREESIMIKQL
jgi:DUF971 family protein